ncbi:hypothetical protein [Vibrio taketomensis]|uniref:hypothetical protein n=1 Tax=Vibrio taketomensis TaxID=2572923 RepID=UPI001389EE44|nr:hypothetical protein [Vibrio taketomensis]
MKDTIKNFISENRKVLVTAMTVTATVASSTANAALDQAAVDAISNGVNADAAIAAGAGFTVLAVVLGYRVGMNLVKGFIASAAS